MWNVPIPPRFALNHMAAPRLGLGDFFGLAAALGLAEVEIRNDLEHNALADGTPPATVRAEAARAGVTIVSINALQRFNDWTPAREAEARALADYASAAGARALVLVPVNDGERRAGSHGRAGLHRALQGLEPILAEREIVGLVEPLGFATCSLRSKREAAEAIGAVGEGASFRLVHDTFHHALAGEAEMYPDLTGLVHVSGVTDRAVAVTDLRDRHRGLVGEGDRLDNVGQIAALRAGGYAGPLSFEPFAAGVHQLEEPGRAIAASIAFITTHLQGGPG